MRVYEFREPNTSYRFCLFLVILISFVIRDIILKKNSDIRHLGKSEVCGIVGSPYQAFGPVLAKHGFVVIVPDVICFEERRKNAHDIESPANDMDFWNHLNEMCYRVLSGNTVQFLSALDERISFACGNVYTSVSSSYFL